MIRADLPVGDKIAQCTHAAGESASEWARRENRNLPTDTHAVCLAAPDEAALLKLEQKLIRGGVAHKAIREPDEPYNGALVAIGLFPAYRKQVKKYVSNFGLVK